MPLAHEPLMDKAHLEGQLDCVIDLKMLKAFGPTILVIESKLHSYSWT